MQAFLQKKIIIRNLIQSAIKLLLAFLYMVVGRCNNVLLVDVRLLSVGVDKRFFCKMVYFLIPLIDNHNYTHSGKNTDSYRYRSEQDVFGTVPQNEVSVFQAENSFYKNVPLLACKRTPIALQKGYICILKGTLLKCKRTLFENGIKRSNRIMDN